MPVEGDAALTAVVAQLSTAGIAVTELALRLPGLDEVFFALTGHRTDEDTDDADSTQDTRAPADKESAA